MPVLIDVEKEEKLGVEERDLEAGVPLILSKEQEGEVVFTSYISTNKDRADWQPEGEWMKEVTTDLASGTRRQPRLTVMGIDGDPRPVSIDDGLIIGLKGTLGRIVGIMGGRAPMSMEEVDAYIDANPDEQVPTFQEWQFRVAYVKKTNGPEARANMLKSEDKKRIESQSDMFKAFAEMFKMGMAQQSGQPLSPDAQDLLNMGIEQAGGGKKGT
tara:strand:- start:9320 stop:9961 length:642 start_codon:yes stop_codon:yes gene_type:complete